jgi:hypothetical protein
LQSQIPENRLPNRLATRFPYPFTDQYIIALMSETYRSKRERWQRLLGSLPANLRDHVSLRNVEAVAALSPQAQARLAEAIQAGLKRLPRALEQLRNNPETSVTNLLQPVAQSDSETSTDFAQTIQKELADLVQLCFPDMPRMSAEALAGAEVMDIAQQTAQVHHSLFESSHLRTDFVMIVIYALMRQTLEQLEDLLAETPALRQMIDQSELPWKPNEWRKQHA